MTFIKALLTTIILGLVSALAGKLGAWLWDNIIEAKINKSLQLHTA